MSINTDTTRKTMLSALPIVFTVGIVVLLPVIVSSYDLITLPNRLQDFITLSLSIFVEAFPFLALGALLAGLVNTYIPPHTFERILPNTPFLRRATISLLGFLFPVCECGNVPLSRSLITQGLKPSEAITFLLAAPVLNPVTIWATWAAFSYDSTIVLARVLATLLIANFIGLVLSKKKQEQEFLTKQFIAACKTPVPKVTKNMRFTKLKKLGESFNHEAFIMVKMLAFGSMVAGSVQVFIPRGVLVSIGSNVVLAVVAMLILAFVVSICANVDAFFALSFASTFTAGSLVSFLVFGPMIDIKMLALLKTTFTNQLLIIIGALSLLLSMATGLVVSYAF